MALKIASVAALLLMVTGLVWLIVRQEIFARNPVALAIQVLAVVLMIAARVTFGGRSFHAAANPTAGGLVTSGPYRWIRHPIYASILYFIWAAALDHLSWQAIAAAALVTFGAATRMYAEERLLVGMYPEYADYRARTARVIPFVLALILAVVPTALIASQKAAQSPPSELAALLAKARVDAPVAAWCRAEFRSGHPGAFAVAVASPGGGGRYFALDTDGTATELARFEPGPGLSCYSRAQAEKLSADISRSETIEGHIAPRWSTTVVCAFTENTAAACWQYSPTDRTFVQVGQWVT